MITIHFFLKNLMILYTCLLKEEDEQILDASIQRTDVTKCVLELISTIQFHAKHEISPSNDHQQHKKNDM